VNSPFKAEVVRRKGPWRSIDDLEIAIAEYIDWYNDRHFPGEIGLVPPVEHETNHYRQNTSTPTVETENRAPTEPAGFICRAAESGFLQAEQRQRGVRRLTMHPRELDDLTDAF